MQEFHMMFRSFQQVQTFVKLAVRQPFPVWVGTDNQDINGKDLMGMSCLDYSRGVNVYAQCSDEEAATFSQQALELLK